MKIKVSDYITNFFAKNNLTTLFTITGGFAMHLNDSFGKNNNFDIFYQHHEQACGYAAVGYAKSSDKIPIVCTTAGCAATNAISPCLVAYQDSLPIVFLSGQVKVNESIKELNKTNNLRHYSGADCNIISAVKDMTKYSCEISSVNEIPYVLQKSIHELTHGRPGPIWLSIPIDIQGLFIDETPELFSFGEESKEYEYCKLDELKDYMTKSYRPLIIAGNGIKLANCQYKFNQFISKYNIPCTVTFLSTDIIESDNDLFVGKIGLVGNRAGNFALQNCDLLICLGCRMAQGVVGYRADWFAREAKIVYVDLDKNELAKENLKYDLKIFMDLNKLFDTITFQTKDLSEWIAKCLHWKTKWRNEMPPIDLEKEINPYHVLNSFFKLAPCNKSIVCSSGSIVTVLWHMITVKTNDKFILSSQGDMGFELPATIGAYIGDKKNIPIAVLGEGSFQLNIQELQTIVQYKMPIKILLFNNQAYGAIQITQNNFFKAKFGVDVSSGISFPDTNKIASAYGIKYICVEKNYQLDNVFKEFLEYDGAIICEVFVCVQGRYPKLSAIKNEDGTFSNRPFEDLEPFLNRDEFKNEMIVKLV